MTTDDEWDLDDITVTVDATAATARIPLRDWMRMGPRRVGMDLNSAQSASTGQKLPKTVIPLAYRNDTESQSLIAAGRIPSPWQDMPWDVERLGPRRCEVFGPRPFDGTALPDVGAVLCEWLKSDARPRDVTQLTAIVDALGVLRYEPAVGLLKSLVGQAVFAYADLDLARRCLRALCAVGTSQAMYGLLELRLGREFPSPVPEWTLEELETFGPFSDALRSLLNAF
ncbi:hypothetical protein [Dactylosporangium sp. CA-139066]|uniref:hypothetical protein n=1 Tax=Dactylosporangium sp. CA-139066 TaxID=3239930 RepID=UPI003D8ECD7B